jgi:hypothetical protein
MRDRYGFLSVLNKYILIPKSAQKSSDNGVFIFESPINHIPKSIIVKHNPHTTEISDMSIELNDLYGIPLTIQQMHY